MPKKNLVRNILDGQELRDHIASGVEKIYQVALASYGVNSGNVLIEHRFGEPLVSHDGITNIGRLVDADPTENAAISIVRQASEKTNRDAGDATTLTVVLTKLAYEHYAPIALTMPPRAVQRMIARSVEQVKKAIKEQKLEATPETLRGVSIISAGDEAIGELVFDAVNTVGKHGGITVVETAEPIISSEVIDGFTFKKGLKAFVLANDMQALKSRYDEPSIIVMSRLINRNDDIMPILNDALVAGHKHFVLIADVSGQALESIVANKMNGKLDIAIVEPPAAGRDIFLADVAKYASTEVFALAPEEFEPSRHIGKVDSAYITLGETTLNGCKTPDELKEYSKDIKSTERTERLHGKTVRISVGAPTQAERQELKLRIEDAVCAAQTAQDYGVLPGGGVFLRDYGFGYGDESSSDQDYFITPFELLTGNQGLDTTKYAPGSGVDIAADRNVEDMVAAGIVDSAKAIEEAIVNSHSAAAQLISINMALPFAEDME